MRLSIKILDNVANVNQWQYVSEAHVFEGQANKVYFQFIDKGQNLAMMGRPTSVAEYFLRYIPQGSVVTAKCTFDSIDDAQVFEITAIQPFADDKSIWMINLNSSQLPKSGYMKITLTEDGVSKQIMAQNVIYTETLNIGSC